MPGYGYARAEKKLINAWQALIKDYLRGRPNLRRVFVLVDSRHGVKSNDVEIMDLLDEAAVVYQIVLTKADKRNSEPLKNIIEKTKQFLAKRPAAHPELHITSSVKETGIAELRAEIVRLIAS